MLVEGAILGSKSPGIWRISAKGRRTMSSNVPIDVAIDNGAVAIRGESNGQPPLLRTTKAGIIGSTDDAVGVFGQTGTQEISALGPSQLGTAGVLGHFRDGGQLSRGFLGGKDPHFHQHAGVYGESDQQGVHGHSTGDQGTGVFGHNAGHGFGVRGEATDGIAVQGQIFGRGLAGKFIGDVQVTGHIESSGDVRCSGDIQCNGDVFLANKDLAERFEINPA
jgi:hypothetical protein